MVNAQAIAKTGLLTQDQIMDALQKGLGGKLAGQKVLVLIPDHTRSMPLPELFRMMVEVLHDAREVNFMVALGTHPGYDEAGLNDLVGITRPSARRLSMASPAEPCLGRSRHPGLAGRDRPGRDQAACRAKLSPVAA